MFGLAVVTTPTAERINPAHKLGIIANLFANGQSHTTISGFNVKKNLQYLICQTRLNIVLLKSYKQHFLSTFWRTSPVRLL